MAVDPAKVKKLTEDYLKKVDQLTSQYKKDVAALLEKINKRKIEEVRAKLK